MPLLQPYSTRPSYVEVDNIPPNAWRWCLVPLQCLVIHLDYIHHHVYCTHFLTWARATEISTRLLGMHVKNLISSNIQVEGRRRHSRRHTITTRTRPFVAFATRVMPEGRLDLSWKHQLLLQRLVQHALRVADKSPPGAIWRSNVRLPRERCA